MECERVAAIQKPVLVILKKLLEERFISHLPPLLGDGPAEDKNNKQLSRAFSAFTLQALFKLDNQTASAAVVDDYNDNDNGVDAIYYHDAEKILYFVQSKLKASEQFQLAEAQAFLSGIKLLINKNFDTFNQNVKNLQSEIEKALDECDQIKLIIAYTGDAISIQAKNEIRQTIQDEIDEGEEQLQLEPIEFNAQDVEKVLRQENAIKQVNDKIRIHKYRVDKNPQKTVFGIVKVEDLVALHKKYDKALYEKNIRYFIGAGKRGVNSAIKSTLLHSPKNFLYLNNGITIIGNSIKQRSKSKDNRTTRDFEVLGMSVVNGAQTISTAVQFMVENPSADISEAQVMLVLINTGNGDFHKQVTKARNLQNPVDLSNFAALDDNQERLRQEIALYGIAYHYRPQKYVLSGIPTIEIDTLTKALACLKNNIRYPSELKSEPSQFTNVETNAYQDVFTPDLSGSKAINAVNVFKVIHELLTQAEKSSYSPEKLIYRHCIYVLASILMKKFRKRIEGDQVLTDVEIKGLISVPFDELRQQLADVYQNEGIGTVPHAFFKRIPDTVRLIHKVTIVNQEMADDQTVQNLQNRIDINDPYNKALTNYLSGKVAQL